MTAEQSPTQPEAASAALGGGLLRVAVVIVTYNSESVIAPCLRSLWSACDGVSLISIVVVDNASSDASVQAAGDALADTGVNVQVVAGTENLGYAAAINRGRALVPEHDALLVLNPDTTLLPGAVRRLAQSAVVPCHGLSVPRMESEDGRLALSIRRFPTIGTALADSVLGGRLSNRFGWGEVVPDPGRYLAGGRVDWATGAAVMVSSKCWDEVGSWDESFFLYGEETEYMLRARDHGLCVWFEPDAVCRHRGGASGSSDRLWALLMANKVRLYGRSHGKLATAGFRAALILGECLRAASGSRRSRVAARSLLRPFRESGTLA